MGVGRYVKFWSGCVTWCGEVDLPKSLLDEPLLRNIFKAAKYEIQKPSTCLATLFGCTFRVDVSRFSPRVINLSRNKNIYCGLRKVAAKS